jgi:radical SAM protein with 4Fe4S-binding SPASM domain
MNLLDRRPLVPKKLFTKFRKIKALLIDLERVNWVVVSRPLAEIVLDCDGKKTIGEIIDKYNINNDTEIKQKLILCFEKLYDLKFFSDCHVTMTEQSHTLDSVYFNLTKKCNLSCVYCYADAGGSAKKHIKDQPLEFWKKAIGQVYDLNNNAIINFTGGEPTIYRYFWNAVEYAKNKGLNLSLITNGVNNDKNINKYLDYFNSIAVSIDSLREEINSLTRGKGSLFFAEKFIDTLIDKGMKPAIMVVVSKYNKKYIHEINNKYRSSAVVKFQPLYNIGRGSELDGISITAKEYYSTLKSRNIERMKDDVSYKRNMKYTWCGMGKNVLSIEANGEVYPCHLMHNKKFKLGELTNQLLEDIWANSPYRHHSVDMIKGCKSCEIKNICSAPCRARTFYVLGSIYEKDPLCRDFIKKSIYDNLYDIT